MAVIPSALSELLDLFRSIDDQNERAQLLIDYAGRFKEVPPEIAARPFPPSHKVPYCESEAYVWCRKNPDGTLRYYFAVENPSGISAKALASILTEGIDGATAEQISSVSLDIVQTIFRQNISMGKGMGLTALVQAVVSLARESERT